MFDVIVKRDGRQTTYDIYKISTAIYKAMEACGRHDKEESERLAQIVEEKLASQYQGKAPGVEDIQDTVETVLMENGYAFVAKKYIVYRSERTRAREMNTRLMHIYDELTFADANRSDMKRDNANICLLYTSCRCR